MSECHSALTDAADMVDPPRYKAATDSSRWEIQERCAKRALERNLLVVLPTGSGKTLIAIEAIKMTLEREPTRSVIFLAPTVPLVVQQAEKIADELELDWMGDGTDRHHTIGICENRLSRSSAHDDQRADFAHVLHSCQVLACTPVKLLHALMSARISMDQIALLVFDEAHHVSRSDPYAVLMQYFYRPLPVEARPRVLALTASPWVALPAKEEEQTLEGAQQTLARIEADLDATVDIEAVREWSGLGAPLTPAPRSPRVAVALPPAAVPHRHG